MMNVLILIGSVLGVMIMLRLFKTPILTYLYRLKAKLHMNSLREGIHAADADKAKTGRKNMLVYNTVGEKFEPIQKKLLKNAAKSGKKKNNGAMTKGRLWAMRNNPKKSRVLDTERVKQIEDKSLYVTK